MFKGVGKGAIALIISGFVCKFLGAIFRLPLTSILGISGIGIFQMVMSLYSLALVFVTGGVTNALSQLISSARARGEIGKISNFFKLSVLLTISMSLIIGLVFFMFASPISKAQGIMEGELSYKLFLILIPTGAFIGVLRGVVQGFENMTPTAISQIIEQVFKVCLGLLFAYFLGKKSVASGVFGGFLGITLSEVVAFVYLSIYALRKIKFNQNEQKGNFPLLIGAILPLSLGNAIIPFAHAIDSLIILSRLAKAGFSKEQATALFGLQTGVVGTILNFPLIISLSLAMTILPKISYLSSKNDKNSQKNIIKDSFIAMWTVVLPLVVGIMAIGGNLYALLYPAMIKNLLNQAIELTVLSGISIIFTAIMQFLTSILQAKGFFMYTFISSLIGGIVKVVIVYILAANPTINIFALPISNLVLAIIICIFALFKLKDLIKIPAFYVFTPLLSSIIMYVFVKLITKARLSNVLIVVIGTAVGAFIYIISAFPVIKGLYVQFFGKDKSEDKKT